MGKKNEYVFNIGFNKNNPEHKETADILNQMGHMKADYISRAITFYKKYEKKIDIEPRALIDLAHLEEMVKNIIKKEENNYLTDKAVEVNRTNLREKEEDTLSIEEKENISEILKGFRNKIS